MAAATDTDARRLPEGAAMSTLTLRLPEELALRLKSVAEARGMSVNKLVTEISVQAITSYDTETRFKAMAAKASLPVALAVIDKLDRHLAQE